MAQQRSVRPAPQAFLPDDADESTLENIRVELRKARDLELEISDLEFQLKEKKAQILEIEHNHLPELFDAAQIDILGLPPEGNLPGYDAKLKPYYNANIAAKWDDDKKTKGFNYLIEEKAGDLIKSTITVRLPMKSTKMRAAIIAALSKLKCEFTIDLSVHSGSLTSWLKSVVENENRFPKLDLIGGMVGKVVELKERKS